MCKSASILLHVVGDERIFDAHLDAVKRTLDIVQERYGQTRMMIEGVRHTLNTNNLVLALIKHHTSRANDPQTYICPGYDYYPDASVIGGLIWLSPPNSLIRYIYAIRSISLSRIDAEAINPKELCYRS
ncbi:MAG: relaxase domain-containing protein [Acaryochloridaceae cyanobacterium SU_2_1]|nr:relaxase domain-containing protein [Acaryochloridaceae cyanobacterium SU_2_1]